MLVLIEQQENLIDGQDGFNEIFAFLVARVANVREEIDVRDEILEHALIVILRDRSFLERLDRHEVIGRILILFLLLEHERLRR